MKKVLLFLLIIIVVFLLGGFLIFKIVNDDKPMVIFDKPIKETTPLKGKKIKDNVYLFTKTVANEYYTNTYVDKTDIYFLEDKNYVFTLSKQNIYSDKVESVATKKMKNYDCSFESNEGSIKCFNGDKVYYYDLKFNLIRNYQDKEETYALVPYKNDYVNANKIDEINNDKLVYSSYIYSPNNSYIIYFQNALGKNILYDLNNKKMYHEFSNNYLMSSNGVLFIKDDSIKIYYIKNNLIEDVKFKSVVNNNYYNNVSVNKELSMIASYNNQTKHIIVENIKDKSILSIDVSDYKFDYMQNIYVEDNYVYLLNYADGKIDIYVFDITNEKFIDSDKYHKKLDNDLNNKIQKLKDDYGINVLIKEKTKVVFDSFTANYEDDNSLLSLYVDKILEVAKRFNKEFFMTYYEGNMKGLNIYLTGSLTPKFQDQYQFPAAYTLNYKDQYAIVLDVNQTTIEENICHELSHTFENNVEGNLKIKDSLYSKWNEYNPSGFNYNISYVDNLGEKYTIDGEKNKDNVYFISGYSHTYPTEDRAQIFEHVCSRDKDLLKYNKLVNKAKYMKDELLKFYPSLQNSTVFDMIK